MIFSTSLPAFRASITARVPKIKLSESIRNKVHEILQSTQIKASGSSKIGLCRSHLDSYLYVKFRRWIRFTAELKMHLIQSDLTWKQTGGTWKSLRLPTIKP